MRCWRSPRHFSTSACARRRCRVRAERAPRRSSPADATRSLSPVGLTEHALENLAGGRARQAFDEVDGLWALEPAQARAAERDHLLFAAARTGAQDDDGLHGLTPTLVR